MIRVRLGRFAYVYKPTGYRFILHIDEPSSGFWYPVSVSVVDGDKTGKPRLYCYITENGELFHRSEHWRHEVLDECIRKIMQGEGFAERGRISYARISNRCSRCGRALSNPQSISRGIGPECIKEV